MKKLFGVIIDVLIVGVVAFAAFSFVNSYAEYEENKHDAVYETDSDMYIVNERGFSVKEKSPLFELIDEKAEELFN